MEHMMHDIDEDEQDDAGKGTKNPHVEKSAKDQLSGELGEIDKLIMLLLTLKQATPPSPFAAPLAGPPTSPSPALGGLGGMPMGGSMPPPPGLGAGGPPSMGNPMMPLMMNQMQAAGGLV
jgi:hypothetical protein